MWLLSWGEHDRGVCARAHVCAHCASVWRPNRGRTLHCSGRTVGQHGQWPAAGAPPRCVAQAGAVVAQAEWGAQVLMTATGNVLHGSSLSPPRRQQIKDCMAEYWSHATPSDPYLQYWLPFIVETLQLQSEFAGDDCEQVLQLYLVHNYSTTRVKGSCLCVPHTSLKPYPK